MRKTKLADNIDAEFDFAKFSFTQLFDWVATNGNKFLPKQALARKLNSDSDFRDFEELIEHEEVSQGLNCNLEFSVTVYSYENTYHIDALTGFCTRIRASSWPGLRIGSLCRLDFHADRNSVIFKYLRSLEVIDLQPNYCGLLGMYAPCEVSGIPVEALTDQLSCLSSKPILPHTRPRWQIIPSRITTSEGALRTCSESSHFWVVIDNNFISFQSQTNNWKLNFKMKVVCM